MKLSDMIKLEFILCIVCMAAGFGLGLTYTITQPQIETIAQQKVLGSLKAVLPGAASFSDRRELKVADDRVLEYFEAYDSSGEVAGYAILGEKQGFQSLITVMAGIVKEDDRWIISGLKILEQAETPGLGARVDEVKKDVTIYQAVLSQFRTAEEEVRMPEPWFPRQYRGLTLPQLIVVKQHTDEPDIDAITGATITTVAVTDAVRESIELFLKAKSGE